MKRSWQLVRLRLREAFGEKYHTSSAQMADLAREAKPKLLLIYHQGGGAGGRPV